MDEIKPENTGIIRDEEGKFVKGFSGNPAGKPKGSLSIVAKLKSILEDDPKRFDNYCEEILKDPAMRRVVMEQIDGKPRQPFDGGKDPEGNIQPILVKFI